MATIKIGENKNGTTSYKVAIRKKNIDIYKTFSNKEDALIYVAYKERLIENMDAFEVDLQHRITISQVFELKIESCKDISLKEVKDMENSSQRFSNHFGKNTCINSISFEQWKNFAEILYDSYVYRGAKSEIGKRKMSASTLRKIFAHASSSISYAQNQGLNLENHPLKVIKTFINPLVDKERSQK